MSALNQSPYMYYDAPTHIKSLSLTQLVGLLTISVLELLSCVLGFDIRKTQEFIWLWWMFVY